MESSPPIRLGSYRPDLLLPIIVLSSKVLGRREQAPETALSTALYLSRDVIEARHAAVPKNLQDFAVHQQYPQLMVCS
jgi:hypothetical protein